MKKILSLLLVTLIASSSNIYAAAETKEYNDTTKHWAKSYIMQLTDKGVFGGYPDGTFKPDSSITRAEFTKILVNALHEDQGIAPYGHWAGLYVNKAIEEGYALRTEYGGGYDLNITRGEMARMISRALEKQPDKVEELKKQILDLDTIPTTYRDHIAKTFAAGIITGYPDETFKHENTATRAEASTMLLRFLDESQREIPEIKKAEEKIDTTIKNYKGITEFPSKPLESLNLGGMFNKKHLPTIDGSKVETAYYATVADFPIRIGNFVITGLERNTKPDLYGFYNVYLKGYALSDDSLTNLNAGYVDNQNQYRYRGFAGFSQNMYDYLVKIYPNIVGLNTMTVKENVPFTTLFEIASDYDWEFDTNYQKFTLKQVEYIAIQDYVNTDKGILFIKNPFK